LPSITFAMMGAVRMTHRGRRRQCRDKGTAIADDPPMRSRPSLLVVPVVAVLLGSCVGGPVDPATFAGAVTLDDALTRAATAYEVPRDLLAAVAWSETRFDNPVAADEHADGVEGEGGGHALPELGPLHLRTTPTADTLARARALLGVSEESLRTNTGLGVAGAAAVLAELGAQTGADPDDLATWAEAVARYSGLRDRVMQVSYASQVFAALRAGVAERSFTGERIRLAAHPGLPAAEERLHVTQAVAASSDYGPARWVAASTSNYNSGRSGSVQYVVIHTMQGSYGGSVSWFQNPSAQASAHYMVRSSDGEITQMVDESNNAWHAGNSFINNRSVGIEHEGFVADPGRWYTERMYVASARLTRALCDRYHIPIDRAHIIGHYQVPRSGTGAPCATGATNCGGAGGHTDPGNGGTQWNWSHYLDLVRGNGSVTPPPPATPAYAATFVGASCPTTATSGDRPVAWFEFRNTGTATWAIASTRLGTTGPRDHRGVFFDMENWVNANRPSGVDHATAPGAVGRFSFVLGIPTVTTATTLTETYGPLQEGVTWFGGETAARCSIRVSPRAVTPPPVDAGTPTADVPPTPTDTGSPAPVDAGTTEPEDAGTTEPVDAGEAIDTGGDPDAGDEPPAKSDGGLAGDEEPGDPTGSLEGGCSAAPSGGHRGLGGGLGLAAIAVAIGARRRRRR
jgi:N-acetyl-anhydromuramyl-L-alanine amidase AmpD